MNLGTPSLYKMKLVILIVFCAVIETQSENGYNGRPYGLMQGYTRIKRVKYSNPPQRFYSRPPSSFSNKGVYSYTPPPGYMMDSDKSPPYPGNSYAGNSYPGNSRPKVSKRPSNEGLGEEDLQNFVKYLSKQDLDKILEFAGHNRDSETTRDPYEKHIDNRPTSDEYRYMDNKLQDPETYSPKHNEDSNKIFDALVKEIDLEPKFNSYQEIKPNNEYKNSPVNYEASFSSFYGQINENQDNKPSKEFNNNQASYVTEPTPPSAYTEQHHIYNALLDTQESMQRNPTYTNTPNNGAITDSKVMPEEILPRPVNLRDDDFDISFTHNVPTVVKADSNYKLENFGNLPLMNYNSKLDTLSSYHVPHYTVTSSSSIAKPSSSSSVSAIEPAPPLSAAKEQSDAHLKAVRIWSHKSKGTAYTLHDDGTLSLEKPIPKRGYGYS